MSIIDKPSDYFNTILYTGTGSTTNITGVGFNPDLVWIKCRSNAVTDNVLFDRVRGAGQRLVSNDTGAEETQTGIMSAFVTDGVTVGGGDASNGSSKTYAMWNWLAGGTASSNTDGSITSSVSANTTSGFSIVSYTGNGSANQSVGHGLGATPKIILIKNRTTAGYWCMTNPRFVSVSDTNILYLQTIFAEADDTNINGTTAPSSTVFGVDDYGAVNTSENAHIAYCWSEIPSYSKFGTYVGNGDADGTFVYTGFKPAYVMVKAATATGYWLIKDNKRTNPFNVIDGNLYAQINSAEDTGSNAYMDFTSQGFKLRGNYAAMNASGQTNIYMAFAEQPFTTSTTNGSIPATAR